jgi:DMSO/TMAO reductase YedYZ heme-binding membrane subunit
MMLTFTASSLACLWPNNTTRAILRDRRWWGLGFAACHTAHLVAVITQSRLMGAPIDPVLVIGGGAAYALLYLMVLTSNEVSRRVMGRYWSWLHTVGAYYLWLVFLQSYLARIPNRASRAVGVVFSAVALAALAMRITMRWSLRSAPPQTA